MQTVHLDVEVAKSKDGEYMTHPLPYVRFPPHIGRNSELEKLRSLAVMIQWLPEGQTEWKQYYVERRFLWESISKTNPALFIYRNGLGMLCDVEKIRYMNGPSWLLPTLSTRVNFLRYDHLQQKRTDYSNSSRRHSTRTLALGKSLPMDSYHHLDDQQVIFVYFSAPQPSAITIRETTHASVAGLYNASGKPLEGLGIAVNMSRNEGAFIKTMEESPFNPDIENEEHAELTGA
ncbi:hypothetical protein FCOIX_4709 [Fusarium coicis]|nr:hypothetical protein FCOIX_4709 [Fusarium coicis]